MYCVANSVFRCDGDTSLDIKRDLSCGEEANSEASQVGERSMTREKFQTNNCATNVDTSSRSNELVSPAHRARVAE